MKQIGIQKARKRLEAAMAAFARVRASQNFDDFEFAWTDFLLATNAIWEILKVASRGHSKNEPWFGLQINIQRKDPLLQYMHQARNSDEHGLEPVTAMRGGGFGIKATAQNIVIKGMTVTKNSVTIREMHGVKPEDIEIYPPSVALVKVYNHRHGDSFDPPKEHLGKKIDNPSPLKVGELHLAFMVKLVEEAARRADVTQPTS